MHLPDAEVKHLIKTEKKKLFTFTIAWRYRLVTSRPASYIKRSLDNRPKHRFRFSLLCNALRVHLSNINECSPSLTFFWNSNNRFFGHVSKDARKSSERQKNNNKKSARHSPTTFIRLRMNEALAAINTFSHGIRTLILVLHCFWLWHSNCAISCRQSADCLQHPKRCQNSICNNSYDLLLMLLLLQISFCPLNDHKYENSIVIWFLLQFHKRNLHL